MKFSVLFVFMTGAAIIAGCKSDVKQSAASPVAVVFDSVFGQQIADTIIYEVTIVNPNPDDLWTEQCLKGLDHKTLIDNVFAMVYEEIATAYNHDTGEKLTPAQVKNLENEEGFARENIGMIQFKEAWYMNPGSGQMTKKVLSMVLGMGVYSNLGEFKGNKAIMRIELP